MQSQAKATHKTMQSRAKAARKAASEAKKCAIIARQCAELSQGANRTAQITEEDSDDDSHSLSALIGSFTAQAGGGVAMVGCYLAGVGSEAVHSKPNGSNGHRLHHDKETQ